MKNLLEDPTYDNEILGKDEESPQAMILARDLAKLIQSRLEAEPEWSHKEVELLQPLARAVTHVLYRVAERRSADSKDVDFFETSDEDKADRIVDLFENCLHSIDPHYVDPDEYLD